MPTITITPSVKPSEIYLGGVTFDEPEESATQEVAQSQSEYHTDRFEVSSVIAKAPTPPSTPTGEAFAALLPAGGSVPVRDNLPRPSGNLAEKFKDLLRTKTS